MAELPRNPKRVLSFTEHLEELRVRLIICIVVFFILFMAGFSVANHVIGFLIKPLARVGEAPGTEMLTLQLGDDGTLRIADEPGAGITTATIERLSGVAHDRIAIRLPQGKEITVGHPTRSSLHFLSPVEPFFLLLKGALLISSILAIPLFIYQMYLFIAPGLTRRERRIVKPILVSSMFLFPLGAAFAYWIAHLALHVLIGFSDKIPGLQPNIVASAYLGFIMKLMLVMGVVFEFPLVLVLLSRIGIVDSTFLVAKRRYAILIISVLAAIFTPPDPLSMIASILPLILLYELSIWAIRAMERAEARAALPPPSGDNVVDATVVEDEPAGRP
jgi:sec-independent protein translocase protein TatC